MTHLPILKHQLYPQLDMIIIELIAKEIEKITLECHRFPGQTTNVILQPSGQGLMIYLKIGTKPSVQCLPMLVPLTEATGKLMLADAPQNLEDLEIALNKSEEYAAGRYIVNKKHQNDISLGAQVNRHNEMIDTEVVDAFLVISNYVENTIVFTEIFIGNRIGELL